MRLLRIPKRLRGIHAVTKQMSPHGNDPRLVRNIGYALLLENQLGLKSASRTLKLHAGGVKFDLTTDNVSDFSLLHDLFIEEEYRQIRRLKDVRVVFDLGANVGLGAIYMKTVFPNSQITCFEPDRSCYRKLVKNVQQFQNVDIHEMAVGGEDGEIEFFENPNLGVASSIIPQYPNQQGRKVPMRAFDSVVDDCGREIDLVKFDIEGAEFDLFRNSKNLSKVKAYIGELHLDMMGCSLDAFISLFNGYSVEVFPLMPQRYSFFALKNES